MGLFSRKRTAEANLPVDPASTLGRADTIPAGGHVSDRLRTQGNAIASKATDIYRKNPKLIGGLAVLASAALLNHLKRPRVR